MPGQRNLSQVQDTHFKIQYSPQQVIVKDLRETRVSQVYKGRMEKGRLWHWAKRASNWRDSHWTSGRWVDLLLSGHWQKARSPTVLLGDLRIKECHRQGPFATQGWPCGGALACPQASWTGGPTKGQQLTIKMVFQIILISFLFPFVLSLYDLNHCWFYL